MGNVTINGSNYTVYGDLNAARTYLQAAVGAGPDAWNALTDAGDDDGQGKLLVSAWRYLERQNWDTTKVADATARAALLVFQQAEYEMAAIALADPTVLGLRDQGSNVMLLRAGPVEVEYFKPTGGNGAPAPKMPQIVQDLIGSYLATSASSSANRAYNSNDPDCEGDFDDCLDSSFDGNASFTRTWPF